MLASFCAVLSLVLLGGCGAPQAQITGTVTFEDRPVTSGTVMAVGKDGVPHYGQIAENGRFLVASVPPGAVQWAVTSPDPSAEIVPLPAPGQPLPPDRASTDAKWFPIPDRYAITSRADLQSNAQPGPNQFDIRLKP